MKNLKVLSFALCLLVVTGLATSCRSGKGKSGQRMNWVAEKVTDKLDLNKEQEAKFRDLAQAFQEQKKLQHEKHKADQEELKTLLLSDKLDKDKTRALMERRENAMKEGFDPVFEKLQVFHSSLTAEQKKEAVKYLEKFEKRFR